MNVAWMNIRCLPVPRAKKKRDRKAALRDRKAALRDRDYPRSKYHQLFPL